jgi:L-alanine-DL-glutamate epimerase-like enolase superfamily enzyme
LSTRITGIRTQCATWELAEPQSFHGRTRRHYDNVIIHVDTDDGVTGTSYVWGLDPLDTRDDPEPPLVSFPGLLQANVKMLSPLVVDEDVFSTSKLWAKIQSRRVGGSRSGLAATAYAGIDMAMWDAVCKLTGQSLYKLLGAYGTNVPVYNAEMLELASGGTKEDYVEKALQIKSRGFKALKMYYGAMAEKVDLERIAAVRDAVGPEFGLMVDMVAIGKGLPDTLKRCRRLEEFDLLWIEDPFDEDDVNLHRQLADAIDTPIMIGERRWGMAGALELLDNHATDILAIEPKHHGGVTGSMKVAALAEAYGIPVTLHANPEIAANLMAALPNGLFMEYHPWWSTVLMETTLSINEDGTANPSELPGIGYTLKPHVTEQSFVYLGKWPSGEWHKAKSATA